MSAPARLPGIVKFLYNHNPFYLISAACIVYTLKLAFQPGEVAYIDPWALMAAMGGYTLMMAVTGFLIVKLGHVWEDARSIFLVLLLLFLATSVTFDEHLNLDPDRGQLLICCGFGLAAVVTEGLLHGLGIRLAALFRGPYYLWLALLYFFPIWVSPEITGLNASDTSWRLLGFPVAAGLLTLSLIPAVRRGSAYCLRNGTPWSWPLFPWTLFGFMGLATLIRTYALTISFSPSDGMQTAFQPYFLVPFLFAVALLLLEMGLVERQNALIQIVLCTLPGLLWLALPGSLIDGPGSRFLADLTSQVGSPLWLTTLGIVIFHTWALIRGVESSRWWLLGSLLLASQVARHTLNFAVQTELQSWPLIVAGGVEVSRGFRRRDCLTLLLACCCLSLALSTLLWNSPWFMYRHTVPYHFALASLLCLGCAFRDPPGRALRIVGAILLPLTATVTAVMAWDSLFLHLFWPVYLSGLAAIAGVCWYVSRDVAFLCSLLVMLVSACVGAIAASLVWLTRKVGVRVLIPLVFGIGSFVVGALISISKGVLSSRQPKADSPPQTSVEGPDILPN